MTQLVNADDYERRIQLLRNKIHELERKHAEEMADKEMEIVDLKAKLDRAALNLNRYE